MNGALAEVSDYHVPAPTSRTFQAAGECVCGIIATYICDVYKIFKPMCGVMDGDTTDTGAKNDIASFGSGRRGNLQTKGCQCGGKLPTVQAFFKLFYSDRQLGPALGGTTFFS